MQAGTLMIALGLGLAGMFAIVSSRRNWAIGLIPMFVGVVLFIFAALNRPRDMSRG